jgi:hypothetical protein
MWFHTKPVLRGADKAKIPQHSKRNTEGFKSGWLDLNPRPLAPQVPWPNRRKPLGANADNDFRSTHICACYACFATDQSYFVPFCAISGWCCSDGPKPRWSSSGVSILARIHQHGLEGEDSPRLIERLSGLLKRCGFSLRLQQRPVLVMFDQDGRVVRSRRGSELWGGEDARGTSGRTLLMIHEISLNLFDFEPPRDKRIDNGGVEMRSALRLNDGPAFV